MRAQYIVEKTPKIVVVSQEGDGMMPLMNVEVQHSAAVIASAFLNPSKQNLRLELFYFNCLAPSLT